MEWITFYFLKKIVGLSGSSVVVCMLTNCKTLDSIPSTKKINKFLKKKAVFVLPG
jgi:hypothetical protein